MVRRRRASLDSMTADRSSRATGRGTWRRTDPTTRDTPRYRFLPARSSSDHRPTHPRATCQAPPSILSARLRQRPTLVGERNMSTVRREESLNIRSYQAENAKVVRLLEKAVTQEPSSSGREWVSGHQDNM